ncbi:tyrosine-type recombinase/integrase [Actinokineospora auranticolor]|uniref:Site-specific recombinase XerD n=1 Tax=Actinokineospora auranticolor TaxID=155976 RepID=A0A2S6GCQ5_9PSEU|nr:tyrosine-type recombinase/integrase [Actinokineospora auranticolor]PPK62760.1 site-specific recombinase XerD [Actinokineospora auranticolor]
MTAENTGGDTTPAVFAGAVAELSVWPGVADPPVLLAAVTDWLAGYGSTATRHTYAGQALGLPTNPVDIERWACVDRAPAGWAAAVTRYGSVMRLPARPTTGPTPPPAPPGRLRHLHWLRWCAAHDLDPRLARASHVKTWLADLDTAGAAPSTRDKMLGAVRALYDHLVADDHAEANPAAINRARLGLTANRKGATRTITLAHAEVAALYHFAGRLPRQRELDRLRARAVVALFTAGIRVSELCDLDRADLHHNRGVRALRVHGKGAKDRIVYLADPVAAAIDDYLRALDTGTAPATRAQRPTLGTPLLLNRNGRRCTRQAIWELLRRIAAAIDPDGTGLAGTLHPHALRHYYVTTAIADGADITDVATDVGHTNTDTTRHVYNSAAPDPARSSAHRVARHVFGPD